MRLLGSRQARFSLLAAAVALCGAFGGSVQASVITPTASLPLLGIPYLSPGAGAGCFMLASACVNPGPFVQTSVVSDMFTGAGQEIVADVTYEATLTPPMGSMIIGKITLTGTVDYTVENRTSNTQNGIFGVDVTDLALSGPLMLSGPLDGLTLTIGLNTADSSNGMTTIAPDGGMFRIDSFFDVFVDISLDAPGSPSALVGPILLVAVPEPSTWAMALLGFMGLAIGAWRRPFHRRSEGGARVRPCG